MQIRIWQTFDSFLPPIPLDKPPGTTNFQNVAKRQPLKPTFSAQYCALRTIHKIGSCGTATSNWHLPTNYAKPDNFINLQARSDPFSSQDGSGWNFSLREGLDRRRRETDRKHLSLMRKLCQERVFSPLASGRACQPYLFLGKFLARWYFLSLKPEPWTTNACPA